LKWRFAVQNRPTELQKANAQGQRIYHITQTNQATILGNIHHHPDTMAEIKNALNVGKEVITHTDAVSVPGWSGAGYIITDPVTGDGAYKISGGGNGGWYTLLAAASTALLMLVITPTGILVSIPILIASIVLLISTVSLALIYGIDFKTYEDEIQFIEFSLGMAGFGALIRVAQILSASEIALVAIIMEIIVGISSLGKNR
jgi:hypothetical protein